MSRCTPTAAALAVAALMLGGCGDGDVLRTDSSQLKVTLDEYRIVPQDVEVQAGRMKFVVRNTGRLTHNLVVQVPEGPDGKPLTVAKVDTMQPGQTAAPIKVTLSRRRVPARLHDRQPRRPRAVRLPEGAGVNARQYRDTIGHFPTGVAVVTTTGPDGPAGMTTNAVTSLSLDPMLLLVCFERRSRTLATVRVSRRFAVNVLREGDEELARVFASKRVGREKYERVTHTEALGVPVLDGALAWIACDLRELHDGGDHVIGIGEVVALGHGDEGPPLVYHRGRYTTVADA